MRSSSPKRTWWFWRTTQERLTTFAHALVSPLKGKRYHVLFETEGTASHDPKAGLIRVNPTLFADEPAQTQFRCTQGLIAHEVGHALFTGAWPDGRDENLLRQMTNILEDQRIENAIGALYPGVASAFELLGDLMLANRLRGSLTRMAEPFTSKPGLAGADACWQAFDLCLTWRWAVTRLSEAALLPKLHCTSPAFHELWAKVKPLVETAWVAENTTAVIALAREILKLLDLPETNPPLLVLVPFVGRGVPDERDGETLPFPAEAWDLNQPGIGDDSDTPPTGEDGF